MTVFSTMCGMVRFLRPLIKDRPTPVWLLFFACILHERFANINALLFTFICLAIMDKILRGIMRYRHNQRAHLIKEFKQIKDNPKVSCLWFKICKMFQMKFMCKQCASPLLFQMIFILWFLKMGVVLLFWCGFVACERASTKFRTNQ
jgi:hypothetical protein